MQVALDDILHEHDFVGDPHVLAVEVALVLNGPSVFRDGQVELDELLDFLEQPHQGRVEVDLQCVELALLGLEQLQFEFVDALFVHLALEFFSLLQLLLLDLLLDGVLEFLHFLLLFTLHQSFGQLFLLGELGHEAVQDACGPLDGA